MCNEFLRSARANSVLYTALLVLCFQFTMVSDSFAQVLACNNVQISMNSDCDAIITPDMILEGAYPGSDSDYILSAAGQAGNPLTITTLGTYQLTITYVPTGQNCWGEVKIEDKLPPQITSTSCGTMGSNLAFAFSAANVVGATTPLTTFGTQCAQFSAGFPGGMVPASTAGFVIRSIPVTLAGGTYTFVPELSTTPDCSTLFYLIPAGTFDINEPCAGAIAPGGVSAATGVIIPGTDYVPAGDYELLVCQGNMNTPCAFVINMNSNDVCQMPCSAYDALLAGDIVTQPNVDENCGAYTCYYNDTANPSMCGLSVVERAWICEDSNGNISDPYVQSYVFAPVDLSEITAPSPVVDLNCGVDAEPQSIYNYFDPNGLGLATAYMNAWPTLNGLPLNEALVCNLALTKTDQVVPACGVSCSDNNKVFRTWTVYDWCLGTSINFGQVIKALDTEDPTIVINNNDITISVDPWGCYGTLSLPSPDILHDNCDSNVSYAVSGDIGVDITNNVVTGLTLGKHILVYTATDCCGNTSTAELVVSVEDLTPPVAIATQNIVVSLTSGSNNGIAKMFANSVDNGSHDGCGSVFFEVRRESDACGFVGNATYNNDGHANDSSSDPDDGAYVKFCCEDISGSAGVDEDGDGVNDYGIVKVWLRVWDYNGNYNETWSDVRVENKFAPAIICPANITIDCTDSTLPSHTGYATALSTCGTMATAYNDYPTVDGCGIGTITRIWSVTNASYVNCGQTITISPSAPFMGNYIQWPTDVDTDCANLGFTGIPSWNSGACDLVAYSIKSDTFLFQSGVCLKILNEFTVIDWCQYDPNVTNSGGIWSHTQVIKVNDNDAPVFTTCDDQVFGADDKDDLDGDGNTCEGRNIVVTNTATDGGLCSSNSLTWEIDVDLWGDGTVDYSYSSSFATGHPYYVAPTINGQAAIVNLPNIDGSMSNHQIAWRALDGCGNIGNCVTNFMVVDNVKPTPYCVSLSTALMQSGTVDFWACDFDLGAFDNCTDQEDLRFTFTSNTPDSDPNYIPSLRCSSKTFDCNDLNNSPGGVVTLDVYVWDEKDNFESCTVQLTLVDNQGACGSTITGMNIAGRVATEEGLQVEDVSVQLSSDNVIGFPLNDMSSISGNYSFYNNPAHLDYELEGVKDGDDMNGVSTLDLVLIQKHIIGLRFLDSPYKVVAADINHDQNVTAIDLVELRKLILGIYSELPSNDSWRFVDKHQSFTNVNSPWPVNELIDINDLNADMMTEDFVAVKIGDVNASATVNFNGGNISSRGSNQMDFVILDQDLVAGETVKVEFRAKDFVNVSGYQMTLNLTDLNLVDLKAGAINITDQNFAVTNNAVSFSWNEINAVTVNTNEVLFTATFSAASNGKLSNSLSISDQLATSEVYLEEGQLIEGLGLEFRNELGEVSANYALLQNEPNPFTASSVIGFRLPTSAQATISFYDVTGKMLKNITSDYAKGYNEVVISRADLPTTGVVYYQLESGSYTASKKMIIVD